MSYKPVIVGVLNLSPESNIKNSIAHTQGEILDRASWLRENGADIIEIGGRSISDITGEVTDAIEQSRLIPALQLLKDKNYTVGIDTWSPATAREMLKHNADMINFTAAELDETLLLEVGERGIPFVTTYMPSLNAETLNDSGIHIPKLHDLKSYFQSRIELAKKHQVKQLIVDPNLGILHEDMDKLSKVHMQIQIIRWFAELRELGCDIYVYSPWKSDEVGLFAMASTIVHHRADYIRTHYPNIITELLRFNDSEFA